jgi:aspartyl-tRNA(Asn)/glutamyl-tRNA(Gln) amidotransferase subunit A
VLVGYDPEDPTTIPAALPSFGNINDDLANLVIGIVPTLHVPALRPDHQNVFQSVVDTVLRAGAQLREMRIPLAGEIRSTFGTIQMAEAYHVHRHMLGTFPRRAEEYGSDVRNHLEAAADVGIAQYLNARQMAAQIKRQFETVLTEVDVLLTPIAAGGPSTTDEPDVVHYLGSKIPFRDQVMNYTVPQNLSGLPACAVRGGFDNDALPVGVQVTAPSGREDLALRVAHSLQIILDEKQRRPFA